MILQGAAADLAPLVPVLGWTLAHFVWQGVLIALILELALKTCSSPVSRHNLALTFLGVMAAAPVATFIWLRADVQYVYLSPIEFDETVRATWEGAAVLIWMVGVAILTLRSLGGALVVERLRRSAEALPAEWVARCEALRRRVPSILPVVFRMSARVRVPAVAGWFRPVVLIPAAAIVRLPAEQLEALILHELAHIRRLDAFLNLFQVTVEILLFYHPAVWWVSRRVRIEREHCCDDVAVAVTRDPATFARALSALKGLEAAPAPALGAGGGLKDRVIRLLSSDAGRRPALSRLAAVGILALAAMALARSPDVEAQTLTPESGDSTAAAMPMPLGAAAEVFELGPADNPIASNQASPDPELLGPYPENGDPAAQAAWRLRSYDIRLQSVRTQFNAALRSEEKAAQGVTRSATASPESATRRLYLSQLEFWQGQVVMAELEVEAHQRARDAIAAAEQVRIEVAAGQRPPEDLVTAQNEVAAAELRIADLARLRASQVALVAERERPIYEELYEETMRANRAQTENLSRYAEQLAEQAAANPADQLLLSRSRSVARQAERERARLQQVLEAEVVRANANAALERVRIASDRARQEELAYAAVEAAVKAGERPEIDLQAATEALQMARLAYDDAQEAVGPALDAQDRMSSTLDNAGRMARAQAVASLAFRIDTLEQEIREARESGMATDHQALKYMSDELDQLRFAIEIAPTPAPELFTPLASYLR